MPSSFSTQKPYMTVNIDSSLLRALYPLFVQFFIDNPDADKIAFFKMYPEATDNAYKANKLFAKALLEAATQNEPEDDNNFHHYTMHVKTSTFFNIIDRDQTVLEFPGGEVGDIIKIVAGSDYCAVVQVKRVINPYICEITLKGNCT